MSELYDALEKECGQLRQQLDTERTARTNAERDLAALKAEAKAANERAQDLQRREGELRGDLKQRDSALNQTLEQLRVSPGREGSPKTPRGGSG
jgi:chromosome segregation ATPase